MREFLASSDLHLAEAVDLSVYRAVREIGSLSAAGNSQISRQDSPVSAWIIPAEEELANCKACHMLWCRR